MEGLIDSAANAKEHVDSSLCITSESTSSTTRRHALVTSAGTGASAPVREGAGTMSTMSTREKERVREREMDQVRRTERRLEEANRMRDKADDCGRPSWFPFVSGTILRESV